MQEPQERSEAFGTDDLKLVLFVGRKIAQRQGGLTLNLGGGRVHQMDQGLNQPRLGLGQSLSIGGVDRNVTEGSGAIVLYIDIGGRKQLNQNRNGTRVDQLLTVVICLVRIQKAKNVNNVNTYPSGSC